MIFYGLILAIAIVGQIFALAMLAKSKRLRAELGEIRERESADASARKEEEQA